MKLSNYFSVSEATRSYTATRWQVDNSIYDPKVLSNCVHLAERVLDPVREHFGSFSPTSWYRCEDLEKIITNKSFLMWAKNREARGMPSSWSSYFDLKSHPKGMAADLVIPGIQTKILYDWIRDNLKFDQLILEFYDPDDPFSGWVHVSYDCDNNRRQALSIS